MFIEFTVGNFRSFKDPVTLSMVAAKINARDRQLDENNTFKVSDDLRLVKSAAVYGANASGKSNLVRAFKFMRQFVLESSKESQVDEPITIYPFYLNSGTEKEPSLFQIVFILDGIKYRYGFEVSQEQVITEWLFNVPSSKEAKLFVRDEEGIKVARNFKEGQGLEIKTRPNALFLSVVAQFNGSIAKSIIKWFRQLVVVSGLDDKEYSGFTIKSFAKGDLRGPILDLVKKLDLGIENIVHQEIDKSERLDLMNFSEDIRSIILKVLPDKVINIKTLHTKWDTEGKPYTTTEFEIGEESEGTQKLFYLSGPVLNTLKNGRTLVIDEMEARLHPLITQSLISLFNSIETNPNNAQLVFTTHDTNLLSNKIFRRDQIWFIEKDRQSSSHLYSLSELKVRNDASFECDYIEGRYGAIPFLGNIRQVIVDLEQK